MKALQLSSLLALPLISLSLGAVEPAAAQEQDPGRALERALRRLDSDGDGRISREEFPGPAIRFRRLDRDGNGFLDRDDLPEEEDEGEMMSAPQSDAEALKFFEERIRPVLVESCYRCHSTEGDRVRGGLLLDGRESMLAGGASGPALVPGNPDASLLVMAMRYTDEDLEMPPKEALPETVVRDFERWVEMGAPWPGTVNGLEPAAYQSQVDIEAGREWWAYQPIESPALPDVRDEDWVWDELDRFVLAQLEARELKAVEDAEDRDWLRRVSLDLIGLPPTPEESDAFLDDRSQDRYELAVDRLLDSPRFGERWGRHWLDVARYAESAGRDSNYMYPHAWRYRDYVIDAFDRDVPYDRFLMEQLAGDLMAAEDPSERARLDIATGYLAIGSKGHNTRDPRQFAADLADEQVNALSQGMLGMTLSCARCHDHKFDPLPASDYYAMAGILRSSETLYGTFRAVTNRHPSDLLELPKEAELSDGPRMEPLILRLTQQRMELLERQVGDSEEPRGRRRQPEMEMGSAEDMQADRIQQRIARYGLATLENVMERFDEDGRATSANRVAMGMRESRPVDVPLLIRGEIEAEGPKIPRGIPQVLSLDGIEISDDSSGRMELAQWVASEENPLTARVWVNRVWLHLFGTGIVATPNNFGASGQAPTHPELLDYLAASFIETDQWSTKSLVRRIVLSHSYRLASSGDTKNEAIDPEALFLWRMPERRLDAEVIRDSMLFASGVLELERPVGSLINGLEGQPRRERFSELLNRPTPVRSIYLPILRDRVPSSLEVFDAADPSFVDGDRQETSVATQALYLMNDSEVLECADALASRVMASEDKDSKRIELAFELTLGREPVAAEVSAVRSFLKDYERLALQEAKEKPGESLRERFRRRTSRVDDSGEFQAWSAFVQTLFFCAEFRFAG